MSARSLQRVFLLVVGALAACREPAPSGVMSDQAKGPAPAARAVAKWVTEAGPTLPEPIANNAVAASTVDGRDRLFSFLGLGAGKDYRAITRHAFALDLAMGRWESLPDVPGPVGRLAATAQAMGDRIYLFGGYSVAADAKETTSAAVNIYDVRKRGYSRGADLPIPVDDTVSGVWRDRLIFLISGWSVANNIDAVQIYDPASNRWSRASPIPGAPVFGHAGAVVGDSIIYCGGARVQAPKTPKYVINPECFRGEIDPEDPTRVEWRAIAPDPGGPRYRAAAGPVEIGGVAGVMFVGGTSNPYNYNGVGYDGKPSEPVAASTIYDLERDEWVPGPRLDQPSMDHRGLVALRGDWWTIGGFGGGQTVSARVARLRPARSLRGRKRQTPVHTTVLVRHRVRGLTDQRASERRDDASPDSPESSDRPYKVDSLSAQ